MIYKYGIDFGTTNSSIAIRFADDDKKERTIVFDLKDSYPKETIPSVLCITENGEIFVGEDAYEQYSILKSNGIKVKLIKKIKMDLENNGTELKYQVGNYIFTGVDLIAEILKELRNRAEQELQGYDINASGTVLGVPVQYGDIQKNILIEALHKAGYYNSMSEASEKTEFVSEPVAVAVHYGLNTTDNKTVMVFDFGGGTLDFAIVNLRDQVGEDHLHPHEVKAKDRLTLGGEDLTKLFFINTFCGSGGYGTAEICKTFRYDKRMDANKLWERLSQDNIGTELIKKVEECKCELSKSKISNFSFIGPRGITLKERKIYREDFEEAIEGELQKINEKIKDVLNQAGIEDIHEVDHVIIAGGSSMIPCVQDILRDNFGKTKVATRPGGATKGSGRLSEKFTESEVLTSIVRGLAAIGCKEESRVEDIVDNSYGLWIDQYNMFLPVIESGIPVKKASVFNKTFQEGFYKDVKTASENQTSVTLKIFQHNSATGDSLLGTIFIEDSGGKKYRIYMHIDPKKGKLIVHMWDRVKHNWISIPQDQSQFNIKI